MLSGSIGSPGPTPGCSVKRPFCEHCGWTPIDALDYKPQPRIVGGSDASRDEYPYQVYLGINFPNKYRACGGSIIASRWILTAAHCLFIDSEVAQKVTVYFGSSFLSDRQSVVAQDYVIHEEYIDYMQGYDIALVKLEKELDFKSANIQPICLGLEEDIPYGGMAVVAGWGSLSFDSSGPPIETLQEVAVNLGTEEDCLDTYSRLYISAIPSTICTLSDDQAPCQGDSGGPLVAQLCDDRWVQVGIVSTGYWCLGPSIYTKVPDYLDWIEEHIGHYTC